MKADLQPHDAEAMLTSMLMDRNMNGNEVLAPTANESPPQLKVDKLDPSTSQSADPVNPKIAEAQDKLRKQMEEREAKMKQRIAATQANKEKRLQETKEAKTLKAQQHEEFKASNAGKATVFLVGIERDIKKADEAIGDSAKCGMRPGFAWE